jgi:hypothetical protein
MKVFAVFVILLLQICFGEDRGLFENLTNSSLSSSKLKFDLGSKRVDAQRDWTIVVYMSGDNNLERFALKDINEMESSIEKGTDVVVLIDRAEGFDKSDGDWTDSRVYLIKKDDDLEKINSELLLKAGELNMGDGDTLKSFLNSAIRTFPAKHYALIMWNHGGGWALNSEDQSISQHSRRSDFLTLNELSDAIKSSLESTNISKLDILGFDMCLMSQIEIANQVKDFVKIMVASQANEPGDGWPYSEILPIFSKGTKGARGVASAIVDKFNLFYSRRGDPVYTLSALDLTLVDEVLNSFEVLLNKISLKMDIGWSVIAKSLFFSEVYQPRVEDLRRERGAVASVDMIDAIKNIVKSKDLKDLDVEREYNIFIDVMDRFILNSIGSKSKKRSNGISIYAPVIKDIYNPEYESILLSKNFVWNRFLNTLHSTEQKKTTTPKIFDIEPFDFNVDSPKPISELEPISTNGFKYKVDGKGILWIKGMYGAQTEDGRVGVLKIGTVVNVGSELKKRIKSASSKLETFIPNYKDGLNRANLYFSGLFHLVMGGGKYHYATVRQPLGSQYMIVPIIYRGKRDGEYSGSIYFDKESWGAEMVEIYIPQKNGRVVSQTIRPDRDDEITLKILYISKDGKESYEAGSSFKWGDGPELVLSYFEKGRYSLGLSVKSLNGISKNSFLDFKVKENRILENSLAYIRKKPYKNSDFVGDWEYIEPTAFMKEGKIVKLGKMASYTIDKKSRNILLCNIAKVGSKQPDKSYYVLPDFRIFPHFRYFKIRNEQDKSGDSDVDNFKIVFTTLYQVKNLSILLQLDTLTYDMSMAVKISDGNSNQKEKDGKDNNPNLPIGMWQSSGGEIIYFDKQGNYKLLLTGNVTVSGLYKIDGDRVLFQNPNGESLSLKYHIDEDGKRLILTNSSGESSIYQKVEGGNTTVISTNSNSNSPSSGNVSGNNNSNGTDSSSTNSNPSSKFGLDGVWQAPGVGIMIIRGNSYKIYKQGVVTDNGIFEVQGDIIVSKSYVTGQIYRYKYRLSRERFDLIDSLGNVYSYFRGE